MAQSLAKVLLHIIFSTKDRAPLIPENLRNDLNAYLVGVLRNVGYPSLQTNCVSDHVHILCSLSKNIAVAKLLEEVKKSTSKWIKTTSPNLHHFYWQAGYGAFSVSQSNLEQVLKYIHRQPEHHQFVTFQEEFLAFLKKYNVEFDERHVWD